LANQLCKLTRQPAPELPPINRRYCDEKEASRGRLSGTLHPAGSRHGSKRKTMKAALERELLEEKTSKRLRRAAPAEPTVSKTTDATTSTSATAQQDDDEESAVLNLCLRLPGLIQKSPNLLSAASPASGHPYSSVHCLASVLAGLAPYQPSVAIAVVDNVLEDIRLGMEINETRLNQRRIACSRYLGELYNYCLVESGLILNTLHSFISFGVDLSDPTAPEQSSPPPAADYISLDPPEHLLRIRLSCVLLQTCGQYFDTGSNKKRLDAYLLYLQQYYWSKRRQLVWSSEDRPFPLDIEYLYTETNAWPPSFKQQSDHSSSRSADHEVEASGAAGATSTASAPTEDEDDEDDDDEKRTEMTREAAESDAPVDGIIVGMTLAPTVTIRKAKTATTTDRASSNSATPQRGRSPQAGADGLPGGREFISSFRTNSGCGRRRLVWRGVGGGVGGPPGFLSASGDPNSVACASNFSSRADAPAAAPWPSPSWPAVAANSRNSLWRYLAAVEADARERELLNEPTLSITEAQMRRDEAADEAAAAAANLPNAEVPHLIGHRQRGGGGGRWQPDRAELAVAGQKNSFYKLSSN
uniref:MIF4G domain-containing protein n=1 Tax=Macrostomum lignano TaxID=282301 RepID=A0A1I8FS55_9PLAT